MYEHIARNRAKTIAIMVGFVAFITLVGLAIGYYIDWRFGISNNYSILIMVIALILAIISLTQAAK